MRTSTISQGLVLAGLALFALSSGACVNTQERTVDAAAKRYGDERLVVGTTTSDAVKSALGSPSEIRKLPDGGQEWTYIKTEEAGMIISTDVGTHYIATYTFDAAGTLRDKSYRATPMGNPLVR